ncbi:uncharacterized protein LOC101851712 [Aplysia californica]|uniref:Uncharacterized protein LOC101851712 n=1 Tax=Aplysia californica TaxID=6500 RepID=A0ABM0JG61_APLCA|nr:uncharacterized protein LOC101851712 [Aplysia californica]XP_035824258.1 uncharacterized protein LOC101851712 [Aplysia californica]
MASTSSWITVVPSLLLLLISWERVHGEETTRPVSRQRVGEYSFGKCVVQGLYPQDLDSFNSVEMTREHALGSRWTERCRTCKCDSFGAWCQGPTCPVPYDFSQEKWCLQWSEDGCCCEQLGCSVDDEEYPLHQEFPYGDGNPCLTCNCMIGQSKDHCLRQKCGTSDIICEDRSVTYDDDCCPFFTCPHGAFCDVIPDPYPESPRHELLDWYRNIDPLPVGMTQHFHIDSWNTYVCQCMRGGTANCTMQSFNL